MILKIVLLFRWFSKSWGYWFWEYFIKRKFTQKYDLWNFKKFTGGKTLRITFDIEDWVLKTYYGTRHFEFLLLEYLILEVKKVVLNIVLIIISQESELIHIIIYL